MPEPLRLTDAEIDARIARYHDGACGYQLKWHAAQAEVDRLMARIADLEALCAFIREETRP